MERFLVIDDQYCKRELELFIKRHRSSVKTSSSVRNTNEYKTDLLLINTASNAFLVKANDIVRCQSNRNYTELYLVSGKKITVSKPLKKFEGLKAMSDFVRVHLSHFVNMNYIDRLVKTGSGTLVLIDGTKLPVSVRRKDNWLEKVEVV